MTKGEAISQTRTSLKAVNADYRMPNKFIWSVIKKHIPWLIRRTANKLELIRSEYLFQTLKCVEIEEAPAIDDCCGVKSKCKVFRTKIKIPKVFEDGYSVVIKSVFTIDGSQEFHQITVQEYLRKLENPNSKYDKTLYFYYNNGYLYFPNSRIRMVMVKGYFEENIAEYNLCATEDESKCTSRLNDRLPIPDHLWAELLAQVLQDIAPSRNIPEDTQIDKNSNNIR